MDDSKKGYLECDPHGDQSRRKQMLRRYLREYVVDGRIPANAISGVESVISSLLRKTSDNELEEIIDVERKTREQSRKREEESFERVGLGPRSQLAKIRPPSERAGGRLSDEEKLIIARIQHFYRWSNGDINREIGTSMRVLADIKRNHLRCRQCGDIFPLAPRGSARAHYQICSYCGHNNKPISYDWLEKDEVLRLYQEQVAELEEKIDAIGSWVPSVYTCVFCGSKFQHRSKPGTCQHCGRDNFPADLCGAEIAEDYLPADLYEHSGPHVCDRYRGHEARGIPYHKCVCGYCWTSAEGTS